MEENMEITAEAREETEVQTEAKPSIGERVKNSRPVKGLRKHWKGAVAGAAGAAAVIGAALVAGKLAADQLPEMPFDGDAIADALPDVGDDA